MRYQNRNSEFNLTPDAIRQLIQAAESPRDKLLIALLAYTGMRRAEVRDLSQANIEPSRREILVARGKGEKQRIVFYPPALDALLENYRPESAHGALFPGRTGPRLSLRAINLIAARVGRRAGIQNPNPRYKNITPHLLRHSLARNWKKAGGSLESLQKNPGTR